MLSKSSNRMGLRQRVLIAAGILGLVTGIGYQSIKNTGSTYLFLDYPTDLEIDMQSSSEGTITDIYTSSRPFPAKVKEMEAVAKFFGADLTLITDEEAQSDEIKIVSIDSIQHNWLRDLFIVDKDSLLATPTVVSTGRPKRQEISLAKQTRATLEHIAREEGLTPSVTSFQFEGGQLLSTVDQVFVADRYDDHRSTHIYPYHLAGLEHLTFEENCCQELYDTLFDSETVFVPNIYFVPEYGREMMAFSGHIDMIMMPGSNGQIIVGDPELGAELLSQATPEEREAFLENLSNAFLTASGKTNPNLVDIMNSQAYQTATGAWLPQVNPNFSAIITKAKDYLEEQHDTVTVPVALFNLGDETHFLSYANVLVEADRGKAVIPSFGFAAMDTYVQEQYRKAGFDDQLIVDGVPGVATHSGIHCDYLELRD